MCRTWLPTDGVPVRGGRPQKPILDQDTVKSLIRISQAGCGASMIFLAFTIVLYAALRWVIPPAPSSPSCPQGWEQGRLESRLLVQHFTDILPKPYFPHL